MKSGFVIVMFLPFLCFGQPKDKGRAGFHSILGAGAMAGESRTKLFLQYSAGLQFDHHFAGIGVGYDGYRLNTIPVFADWRMNFGPRRVLFIYANVGASFAANYPKEEKTEYFRQYARPGLYTDAGFGYRAFLGGSHRLSLSVGHSLKRITDVHESKFPCGFVPCDGPPSRNMYRYNYTRIVVKAGWEFGK
jgi:hypothetical protein